MATLSQALPRLLIILGVIVGCMHTSSGADHTDAPIAQNDPAADIADLYVFHSTDTGDVEGEDRTVFVMTVFPFASRSTTFSDAVDYEFIIIDRNTGEELIITCGIFDRVMECINSRGSIAFIADGGVDDFARNNLEPMIMYIGLRDDPFFFDHEALETVYRTGDISPLADDVGTDFFAGSNVLAIVVDVHESELPGTDLAVWARTVRHGN